MTKEPTIWENKKQKIEIEKIELEISESLNSIFEKAKKNRFLIDILTDKNIYKLTQMYEEAALKKGLIYLYKNVKKDIPNFTYLLKILESGIAEQEINLKVISQNQNKENSENSESSLKDESTAVQDQLYLAYQKFPEIVKKGILTSAKELYMNDVNIKKMTLAQEKFFTAAEKQYILKILNGDSEEKKS